MNRYEREFSRGRSSQGAPNRPLGDFGENDVGTSAEAPIFDFRGLWGLFRRRKWTIIVTTLLGVAAATLYVSQVERQYTAFAALAVDTRQSDVLGLANNLNDTLGVYSIVATEMEIIRSSRVLLKAAEVLNLPSSPVFDDRPSRLDTLLSVVGLGQERTAEPTADPDWATLSEAERADWAARLGAHMYISQRDQYTAVIMISMTTPLASASAAWANAVARAYIEEQVLAKLEAHTMATNFLRERVDALAIDVGTIETQIDTLIFDAIDRAGTPGARATLAGLRAELGALEDQRTTFANLNVALTAADYNQLALLVEEVNPGAAAQRANLVAALEVETEAARRARIQADLAELETEIRRAAAERVNRLQTQMATQEEEVATLQTQLNTYVTGQALPNDVMVDVFQLQQDAETTRDLYSTYLTRLREAEQQAGLALPDTRIVANAVPPGAPSYPSVRSTLIMAFVLAGAAGLGLAFMRENLIGGIATPEQLEHVLRIPVISSIPRFRGSSKPSSAVVKEPMSEYSEAVRRARLGIETFAASERPLKVLVTSAVPDEGKTTVAVSLALSFAEAGRKTLLIDADLRRPAVHQLVRGGERTRIKDSLEYDESPDNPNLLREKTTGLYFFLREEGELKPTDTMILGEKFRAVVDYAVSSFDCIIFDSPPVGLVIDAAVIAREYANITLFVLRADSTPQRPARAALRNLEMHSDIPVVGVLNQSAEYNSYYRKYSGYYYESPGDEEA